jgi:hypothetical protein
MQRIFIKKCFLFTMGSVYRVKRFTAGWQNFRWWRRGWNGGAEVVESTVKICCGLRSTGKTMGQVYQCWWRICREIKFFRNRILYVSRFVSICNLFTDSASYLSISWSATEVTPCRNRYPLLEYWLLLCDAVNFLLCFVSWRRLYLSFKKVKFVPVFN